MLLVHEMVAQARTAACDAAIREDDIECTQRRGDAVHKQTVAEAYGSVSAESQCCGDATARLMHLKAGVRPKKAMKVRAEMATVKPMMARTTVMVQARRGVWAWRGFAAKDTGAELSTATVSAAVHVVACRLSCVLGRY